MRADIVTDPAEARAVQTSTRALRLVLVSSLVLDAGLAAFLIGADLAPAAIVIPAAIVWIGSGVVLLRRSIRRGEERLANFRDPVTGQVRIPGP